MNYDFRQFNKVHAVTRYFYKIKFSIFCRVIGLLQWMRFGFVIELVAHSYNSLLPFRNHHPKQNNVSSLLQSPHSLLGSGFQQRTVPFLWVPELSPISATSFSQQRLICIL
jgi:hypothetical protein